MHQRESFSSFLKYGAEKTLPFFPFFGVAHSAEIPLYDEEGGDAACVFPLSFLRLGPFMRKRSEGGLVGDAATTALLAGMTELLISLAMATTCLLLVFLCETTSQLPR